MKLIYCIASVHHPGGMERVLLNKLCWFVRQGGYDLTVVTTDQSGLQPFYAFPPEVKMIDLDINYAVDNQRSPLAKIVSYFRKRRLHRKRLSRLLLKERADIVVSLYPSESSFIPRIQDGSKKVLELHYNKFFRLQYNRRGLLRLADRFRTWQDERIVRRFDQFVVLTHEDAAYWGALPNLTVIPNAAIQTDTLQADTRNSRRVIAVGRLDYQKGFDRLIEAWNLLPVALRETWNLAIFGQGEWQEKLTQQIRHLHLEESVRIYPPTTEIAQAYASSAFLAMSSHYEGFPMVMIEAMGCGLPVVTFDYPCGPKDIIRDGENGFLVKEGDIEGLSQALGRMMTDEDLRICLGKTARLVLDTYRENTIMQQWTQCFQKLLQ
ncbi:MAG: glycosyltransferase family 4 protein [Bacteroidales bacterium]|nr:glycosyltransferase family 4 protein [Bacteroidales bacterium]